MYRIPEAAVKTVKKYADYTVEELSSLSLLERISLQSWTIEYVTILSIVGYIVLFLLGSWYNQKITKKYLTLLTPFFTKTFYQYGVQKDQLYIKDVADHFTSYATGRANIAKVGISIQLKPRHNLFLWSTEAIMSFFFDSIKTPEDTVVFDVIPFNKYDNFIFGIVSKLGMDKARKLCYYLSLTRTSDSPKLPESFVFMSEANELQEKLFTKELELALDLSSASYIKSIAFTDQPQERPEKILDLKPSRRVVIQTKLVTGDDQLAHIGKVLEAIFNVIDKLSTQEITLKPETAKKIVRTREIEIGKLKKIEEDEKQEKLADEKARQRKAEREQLRKLSPEEQEKIEKKAAEKRQKKLLKKQRIRG